MNRFTKKVLLAVAALIGTCGIGVSENKAEAHGCVYENPCHHGQCSRIYYVYCRESCHSPWCFQGSTGDYNQAVNAVSSLQASGYQTFVR